MFSIIAICFVSKILQNYFANAACREIDEDHSSSRRRAVDDPVRNAEWVRQMCCNFLFSHGVTVTQLMLVTTALVKQNIVALVYLFFFYRLYQCAYYPSRFLRKQAEPETVAKRKLATEVLNHLILWTSIIILTDYSVFVFHEFSKGVKLEDGSTKAKFLSVWEKQISKLCFESRRPEGTGMECIKDWNSWLSVSIDGKDQTDLIF